MDAAIESARLAPGKRSPWDSKGIRVLLFLGSAIVLSVVSILLLVSVRDAWAVAVGGAPFWLLGLGTNPDVTCLAGWLASVAILIAGILAKSRRRFVGLYVVFCLVHVLNSMSVVAALADFDLSGGEGWIP